MGMIGNFGSHHPSNPASDAKVQPWYNHPWDAVLRPTNQDLANLSADMQIEACNNNNVIYIFGGKTYHTQLAKNGYNPSAISVSCGTDCMGSVFANIKGACARLGISTAGIPDVGTGNADALLKLGYQKFTDADHTKTDAHALRGDVYVKYNSHACLHVGDGNVQGTSTGTDSSAGGNSVNLNVEAMSPYILKVPESDVSFDGDKFKESQICGLAFSAGYLYASSTHVQQESYINPNLKKQVERANSYNLPFALIAEVRARTVGEAENECKKLYYVCASAIPAMSLWLHLDFTTSKDTNNRILEYYIDECSKWGFKNTLGIYVNSDELSKIDWSSYSDKLYLWKVDHTLDVSKYVGVLPFSTYTGNIGGNLTGGGTVGTGGQEYQAANAKQKAIVDACKTTPSPGAGWCAAWVTYVYMNAGAGHPTGNACDMYWNYCKYSDKSQLKVGMLIAVPSHPNTTSGKKYGHVGIYIGDGKVMENIGNINTRDLDSWISYYGKTHTPKWGFGGTGIA